MTGNKLGKREMHRLWDCCLTMDATFLIWSWIRWRFWEWSMFHRLGFSRCFGFSASHSSWRLWKSELIRYALKRLDFPAVNPVNEGLASLIMVSIIFGIVGNDCWTAKSPIAGLEYYYLYIIFVLGFSTVSVTLSAYRINIALGTSEHIACYGPVTLVTVLYFLLIGLLSSEVTDRNMFPIGYAFGFAFARLVVSSKDRCHDRPCDWEFISGIFTVNDCGECLHGIFDVYAKVHLAQTSQNKQKLWHGDRLSRNYEFHM